MNRKPSKYEEERTSGVAVAVFSIVIVATALFICTLVCLLTMTGKAPLPDATRTEPPTSPITSNEEPELPSTPVFSPSALSVLPKATESTSQIVNITSAYAALIDVESGKILAAKNADARFNPASMTKIMTLLVACERLTEADLDKTVTMTEEIHNYVRSGKYAGTGNFGFDVEDVASVRALLYGIGVKSAADCTMMVVRYLGDSEETFVSWMNEEAATMGLQNTHFENAVGMEGETHYSTASEMAAILLRALDCPLIREILSAESYDFPYSGYNKEHVWVNATGHYYSTLFRDRMNSYKDQYGVAFSLSGLTLRGGKTGTLTLYSLATYATDATGKTYILVTGETSKSAEVLRDAKTVYETYAK